MSLLTQCQLLLHSGLNGAAVLEILRVVVVSVAQMDSVVAFSHLEGLKISLEPRKPESSDSVTATACSPCGTCWQRRTALGLRPEHAIIESRHCNRLTQILGSIGIVRKQ